MQEQNEKPTIFVESFNDIMKYVMLLTIQRDSLKIPILKSYNKNLIKTIPELYHSNYSHSMIDRIWIDSHEGICIDIYKEIDEKENPFFDIAIGYD